MGYLKIAGIFLFAFFAAVAILFLSFTALPDSVFYPLRTLLDHLIINIQPDDASQLRQAMHTADQRLSDFSDAISKNNSAGAAMAVDNYNKSTGIINRKLEKEKNISNQLLSSLGNRIENQKKKLEVIKKDPEFPSENQEIVKLSRELESRILETEKQIEKKIDVLRKNLQESLQKWKSENRLMKETVSKIQKKIDDADAELALAESAIQKNDLDKAAQSLSEAEKKIEDARKFYR